jgi:hypothetical protein
MITAPTVHFAEGSAMGQFILELATSGNLYKKAMAIANPPT